CTAAWVAAGGLRTRQRRLARVAVVGGVIAALTRMDPSVFRAGATRDDQPEQGAGAPVPPQLTRQQGIALATSVGVSTVVMLAGRRLEKRWLAGLIRQGHPRPHRALAARMAALSLSGSLPTRLFEAHASLGHADR
ncbi:MAG TPA: hypothetical protein VF755_28085, partial [Catenuloplanes sp.]